MGDPLDEEKVGFPWEFVLPVVLGSVFFALYGEAPAVLRPAISRIAGISCFLVIYRAATRRLSGCVELHGPAAFRPSHPPQPVVTIKRQRNRTEFVCKEFDELRRKLSISLSSFDYFLYTLELKRVPKEILEEARAMEHKPGRGVTPEQIASVIAKMEEFV